MKMPSPGLFFCWSDKHNKQNELGKKNGFVWLTGYSSSLRDFTAGAQDRNLETGSKAVTKEEQCLLACSTAFHILPMLVCLEIMWSTISRALLQLSAVNEISTDLPIGQSHLDSSSFVVPYSSMNLDCIKLTIKANQCTLLMGLHVKMSPVSCQFKVVKEGGSWLQDKHYIIKHFGDGMRNIEIICVQRLNMR